MSFSLWRALVFGAFCTALMLNCGKDSTSPGDNLPQPEAKIFAGKITSIDEQEISWDGLRFGLITFWSLEIMGEVQYYSGEAFCAMDIGADSTFSFSLPAQIESRWIFTGFSCHFEPVAYIDSNGNGVFDYEPEPEPYEILAENGETGLTFLYVRDPQHLQQLGEDVSIGWNYFDWIEGYSTDFDREFLMGTY